MTYPPQQPEDGWDDQQPEQAVDPFAPSGTGQPAAPANPYGGYPQQPAQYPGHAEPPTDQTQSLQGYQQHAEEHTQVIGQQPAPQAPHQQYAEEHTQVIGQQPAAQPPAQQYPEPAPIQQPYQQQQPVQPAPVQPPAQPAPVQQPYQQPAPVQQPYQQQPAQPVQQPYPQQPAQPYEGVQPVSADPASGAPYPAQPFSAAPASGAPASGQPYQVQPSSGQPYQAQPASGQPYPGAPQNPPGVPASPFTAAAAPNLPQPVSASPTSGQPWGVSPTPQFTPKQRKGLPSWVYVIGAVVVVAALAVGGVFYFGVGNETGDTGDQDASASAEGGQEATPITDSDSGFTYLGLPAPWKPMADVDGFDSIPGFATVTGQALVGEEGSWTGVFGIGGLDTGALKYKDGDALDSVIGTLADQIDMGHWKDPADGKTDLDGLTRDNDPSLGFLRVDGRRAVTATYHMSWKSDAVTDSGSTVRLGVLDTGDGTLAAYFVDIPDSAADAQTGAVDDALLSLQFE